MPPSPGLHFPITGDIPIPMRSPSQHRADKAYRQRLRALGLTLVSVWVPASRAAELLEIARRMREEHSPTPVEISPPQREENS
jgi:hypothetical protein